MKTKLIKAVYTEPITFEEVKKHLRLDLDYYGEDETIEMYIKAAREFGEDRTGHAFAPQTWEIYLDTFPDVDYINWFLGPLTNVDYIKYKDKTGNVITMTENIDYIVDVNTFPGKIFLPDSKSWPCFSEYPYEAVTIKATCGYIGEEPYILPSNFKQAMMLHVGYLNKFRDTDIPKTHLDTIEKMYITRKAKWL